MDPDFSGAGRSEGKPAAVGLALVRVNHGVEPEGKSLLGRECSQPWSSLGQSTLRDRKLPEPNEKRMKRPGGTRGQTEGRTPPCQRAGAQAQCGGTCPFNWGGMGPTGCTEMKAVVTPWAGGRLHSGAGTTSTAVKGTSMSRSAPYRATSAHAQRRVGGACGHHVCDSGGTATRSTLGTREVTGGSAVVHLRGRPWGGQVLVTRVSGMGQRRGLAPGSATHVLGHREKASSGTKGPQARSGKGETRHCDICYIAVKSRVAI